MDSSSKVLCWRIALGEEKEEKLKEPLTQEEKELVKEFREEVEEYRKAGMEDFLYAIDFDLE
jgi:hypothetical protein